MRTKPFLKWVGGKTQLLDQIHAHFPQKVRTYYEPFLGGGAVFLSLPDQFAEKYVLNDLNAELHDLYSLLKSDWWILVDELDRMARLYSAGYYYEVRAKDPKLLLATERAARFIFLNKTGFNGLYRVNKKGQFNVPFGKRKECPQLYVPGNLAAAHAKLQNAHLTCEDAKLTVRQAGPGDLVYCDPPYVAESKTASFVGYTSAGFTMADQTLLKLECEKAAERGATVVLSNSGAAAKALDFSKWAIHEVQAKRSVNSDGKKRGQVTEIIAVIKPLTSLTRRVTLKA